MLAMFFSFNGRAGRLLFWMSLLGFWVGAGVVASMEHWLWGAEEWHQPLYKLPEPICGVIPCGK